MVWAQRLFACVSIAAAAPLARAAAWEMAPYGALYVGYEDNVRMTTIPVGSAKANVQLGGTLTRFDNSFDWLIEPNLSLTRFNEDESSNREDASLASKLLHRSETSEWNVNARFVHDTTRTSEIGTSGEIDANRQHSSFLGGAQISSSFTERWQAEAKASWETHDYGANSERDGLFDYDFGQVSTNVLLSLSERGSFGVAASGSRQSVDVTHLTGVNYGLSAMTQLKPSERWSINASVGPSWVESGPIKDHGIAYDLSVRFRSELAVVESGWSKQVIPTGNGTLSKSERFSLSGTRQFTERLSATLIAQWFDNEDLFASLGIRLGNVRYARVALNGLYMLTPTVSVSVNADRIRQERRTTFFQDFVSVSNGYIVTAGVVWRPFPKVLH